MYVVSLTGYIPPARFDNLPWTIARIEESDATDGVWSAIQSFNLIPLDANPASPQERDFTTTDATLENGWYRIVWVDAAANESPTDPVQRRPDLGFRPTLTNLGNIMSARTRDSNGNILGSFSNTTSPTAEEADIQIDRAMDDIVHRVGKEIPADLYDAARDLVALRSAMYIELAHFPNEVAQNRSPYNQYKTLFDETLPNLLAAIEAEESGEDPNQPLELEAQFTFPPASNWLYGRID